MNHRIAPSSSDPSVTPFPVTAHQELILTRSEVAQMNGAKLLNQPIPIVLTFRGPLDRAVLGQALNQLVSRHAALRAQFHPSNQLSISERRRKLQAFRRTRLLALDLHCQTLVPATAVSVALPVVDISHLSEEERLTYLDRAFEDHFGRPFDQPPLLRATLYRTGPEENVLQLVVDHMVCDVWSMRVLKRDLLLFYERIQFGRAEEVAPPEINFFDYAVWERERISDGYFDMAAEFWRSQWVKYGNARVAPIELPCALHPSATPTAPRRSSIPGFAHAVVRLSDDLTAAVRRFAAENRCTVHNALLAAFSILLHQYTGRDSLGLCGHFANRMHPETGEIVGWLSNAHLIGIEVSERATIGAHISGVNRRLAEAFAHQQMPLDLLWQRLNCAPRHPDVQPLLDTYPTSSPVSLGCGLVATPGPAPVGGGRVSQFGVYLAHEGSRFTLNAHTSLASLSQEAASALVRDMTRTIENLVQAGPEDTVGHLGKPDAVGNSEKAALAKGQMNEYVVFDAGLIPELRLSGRGA